MEFRAMIQEIKDCQQLSEETKKAISTALADREAVLMVLRDTVGDKIPPIFAGQVKQFADYLLFILKD